MKEQIVKLLAILALVAGLFFYINHINNRYEESQRQNLALTEELNQTKEDAVAYYTNLKDLEGNYNERVQDLLDARNEIRVKDKKIKYLLGNKETIYITDSVYFNTHDTVEVPIYCDTTFKDSCWYSTHLYVDPTKATVSTTMESHQNVIIYQTREYINPDPCWFKRLFQRKHTITRVHIKEMNPYIIQDSTEHIFIENK